MGDEAGVDMIVMTLLTASFVSVPLLIEVAATVAPAPTNIDSNFEILYITKGNTSLGNLYGFIVGILAGGAILYLPRGPLRSIRYLVGLVVAGYLILKYVYPLGSLAMAAVAAAELVMDLILAWTLKIEEKCAPMGLAFFFSGILTWAFSVLVILNSPQTVLNLWLNIAFIFVSIAWLVAAPLFLE